MAAKYLSDEPATAEAALRESEEYVRAIIDTAIDGIITIDELGIIESANPAAERIFCYSVSELRGRNVKMLMPSPDNDRHDQYIANYLRTGHRKIIGIGREVTGLRKDGTEFPMDLVVTEIAVRGQRKFVGFVASDIAERKDLERKLLRAQRLESIGTLAGGIAHDLNNVLTPILMAVRMLRKGKSPEEQQGLLDAAESSVHRGVEIVRHLLAFAGGSHAERTTLRLADVVNEIATIMDHTFAKSINVNIDIAEDICPIRGDATQLTQVLLNMCVNSRDAMPEGGTLSLTARNVDIDGNRTLLKNPDARDGPYVVVRIEDTGAGIPAKMLDRVFDPFFTTKDVSKGTGLGLATAQGIVKAHGGFINLYSEEGSGTVFSVYLPADLQSTPTARVPKAKLPAKAHGELILVVDDETLICAIAKTVLESAGYRVLTASGGEEALTQYDRLGNELAAIVLDMMMPGLDGRGTIKALRGRGATVPIIVTSGLHMTDAAAVIAPPVVKFLSKPYSDDELLAAVGSLVQP